MIGCSFVHGAVSKKVAIILECTMPKFKKSSQQLAQSKNYIDQLTGHILISKLSVADLKDIVLTCGNAHFEGLKNRSIDSLH